MNTRSVRRTDDDAAASKLSAVRRGYFSDKYVALFAPARAPPRLPLINIGTYCRVKAVSQCVEAFLQSCAGQPCEIVSLGAGSDTLPFYILQRYANVRYVELDFPETVARKRAIIAAHADLVAATARNYELHAVDLRAIAETDPAALGLRFDGPTLVLSECCLCYLRAAEADAVLHYFLDRSPAPAVFVYEPLARSDSFGRVMIENFQARGIVMPTIETFPDLDAQVTRFAKYGLRSVVAKDMYTFYSELPEDDRRRIASLEFLDELEEMQLLMSHYCYVCAH